MNQLPGSALGAVRTPPSNEFDANISGLWLLLARVAWFTLIILIVVLFVASTPTYFAYLHQLNLSNVRVIDGRLTPSDVHQLVAWGLSPDGYAWYNIAVSTFGEFFCLALGSVIFWRRSNNRLAFLASCTLVLFPLSISTTRLDTLSPAWLAIVSTVDFLGSSCLTFFFYVFPDGNFVPRWTRWLAMGALSYWFALNFIPVVPLQASFLGLGGFLVILASLISVQVYRYRRVSSLVQRQQTKWVVSGLAIGLGGAIIGLLLLFALLPLFSPVSTLTFLIGAIVIQCFVFLIPLSISIAILLYRLWDIDIIINRTLVYSTLTLNVIGIYTLVVGYLGALFRTGGNLLISLIATSLVAVLFQPLRGLLQRSVNRLLYGQRDEPYAVVMHLSQRLEETLVSDAILPTIVETVAQALKLPYAAILLKRDDAFELVASYGKQVLNALTLPLNYQGETIGELQLAPRAQSETFTSADRRLLDELARHAGLAAHAVRLTSDLQRSRERIVTAREEERRRLRRDLHDGLGATLAALHLQAGSIRTLMQQDPIAAEAEILDLQAEIRSAVSDIRRLVYALRPPALDELGLVEAIRQYAVQYDTRNSSAEEPGGSLSVVIEAPEQLSTLPAVVEVAVYRVVQEALTNVVRHAQAHSCCISLSLPDNSNLQVEITDDGVGLPKELRAGVGLLSMRERAEEVGGSCVIESIQGRGTRVLVHLPLPKE